jgi:hypothetical protein
MHRHYTSPDSEDNSEDQKSRRLRSLIDKAKESLPLRALIRMMRDWDDVQFGLCPFHDDHRPSFSLFKGSDGEWYWKCHAGCGGGDQINYLETKLDVGRGRAIGKFLELAGVGPHNSEKGGGKFRQ